MTILSIRLKSTNYYFVDAGKGLLAFDAGWPNTYREYRDGLKQQGYSLKDVKWLIVSHFHIDHAGLAGALADNGVVFVVFPNQPAAIDEMESLIARKNMIYHPLDRAKMRVIPLRESRGWLESIGVRGEVLHTNGHSEDSISLLLDDGTALIGDLTPYENATEDDEKSRNSWQLLRGKGARMIYPAHANGYLL